MELNIAELQVVFELLVEKVETLWDVFGEEDLEREEMMDVFVGSCRLLERYNKNLGWRLPDDDLFQKAWTFYKDR